MYSKLVLFHFFLPSFGKETGNPTQHSKSALLWTRQLNADIGVYWLENYSNDVKRKKKHLSSSFYNVILNATLNGERVGILFVLFNCLNFECLAKSEAYFDVSVIVCAVLC